ncbi:MAG: sulfatase [Planctomycetes bacterium]|nr:sulfatase [Planctomycetota bacterium]
MANDVRRRGADPNPGVSPLVFLLSLGILGMFCLRTARAGSAPDRPNIVVFLCDDHGYLDSTVYGATDVRTPNMQRLAGEGLTFAHAFIASPSCAPSRAALLSGLMPARNGAEANHSYAREGTKSLPACLHDLGYEVASFGKVAHGADVARWGFDHFTPSRRFDLDEVARFLEERQGDRPLCLFAGTHDPHVPWTKNATYDPAKVRLPPTFVDTPETRAYRTDYYTEVSRADADLGRLYDMVRARFGANLLFLYTSDHGAQWPFGKWNLYDASIRTPLLAVWPGVIDPGAKTDAMVSWIDILPTFIEVAGGAPPPDLDGRSFAGVLRGRTTQHRAEIFTTHSGDGRMNVYPIRSIRTRDWKYILNLHPEFAHTTHIDKARAQDGGGYWISWYEKARRDRAAAAVVERYHRRPREELYDLRRDPSELENLAADPAQSERLARLRGRLETWMEAQGDRRTVFDEPRLLSDPASTRPGPDAGTDPPAAPARAAGAARRPNFLLIIADDLCWRDLGFTGNDEVRTPNLDRLRTEGMYLRGMYTPATTCSPSRHALYTGLYCIRAGAYPNHTRAYDGTRSLFTHLKERGYRVALQNKTHVGPPATFPYEHIGKDEDDFEAAARFIRRDRSQPWFLVFASNDPHGPWTRGPKDLYDPGALSVPPYLHDNAETRRRLAAYYAEITKLDAQVGALMEILAASGQAGDTLVAFVSEQGSSFPYGGKWSVYDNGIRVATLVRWPGKVKPGSTSDALVQYVDVGPTFLAAAGIDPAAIDTGCPDASGNRGFDGRSFLDVLLGRSDRHREYVFAQHTTVGINGYEQPYPMRAVRDRRYKLIRNLAPQNIYTIDGIHRGEPLASWRADAKEDPRLAARIAWLFRRPAEELYDLDADPYEMENLAGDPKLAEVRIRLGKELDAWMAQQRDEGMATELRAISRQGKARQERAAEKAARRGQAEKAAVGESTR